MLLKLFFIFGCLYLLLLILHKKKNKHGITYHKYEAKNVILAESSRKEDLINILAIKHDTVYENINFLYNGNIIINNAIQKEKWGRNGINYKIYYPFTECVYAENCGWEDPIYWEDKIISDWNETWSNAYKQYQLRVGLPSNKSTNQVAKIVKGPW